MSITFTAVYRKVPEGYIGFVEDYPALIADPDEVWAVTNKRPPEEPVDESGHPHSRP
jgi:hypothetical protein